MLRLLFSSVSVVLFGCKFFGKFCLVFFCAMGFSFEFASSRGLFLLLSRLTERCDRKRCERRKNSDTPRHIFGGDSLIKVVHQSCAFTCFRATAKAVNWMDLTAS